MAMDTCPIAGAPCPAWCEGPGRPHLCRHHAALTRGAPAPGPARVVHPPAPAAPAAGPAPATPSGSPATPGAARAGLLCPALMQGGAEAWMLALARHVDAARVSWRGCAVVGGGVDPAMEAALARAMPVARGGAAARRLAGECDVLVQWAVEDVAALLDGLPRRPRVVSVAHSPAEWAGARALYEATTGTDLWAAVGPSALRALPEAARHGARVIGNCVDPARLAPARTREAMHAAWGVPPGALVAGYYGRISHEKRPDAMVRLAAALPDPWRVVVVGPDHMPGLAAGAAGVPRLRWAGPDPAAGDVLGAFDVLVVPSDFESFGLTIAEGLRVGLPVVSTAVGIAEGSGLTRAIAAGASGPEVAREVEAAVWEGRPPGQLAAIRAFLPSLDPARFGRAWTDLIAGAAGGVACG